MSALTPCPHPTERLKRRFIVDGYGVTWDCLECGARDVAWDWGQTRRAGVPVGPEVARLRQALEAEHTLRLAVEVERDLLRAALARYGTHASGCGALSAVGPGPQDWVCTCGLAGALAGAAEGG